MADRLLGIEEIDIDRARHEMHAALATDTILEGLRESLMVEAMVAIRGTESAKIIRESITADAANIATSTMAFELPETERAARLGVWATYVKERHDARLEALVQTDNDLSRDDVRNYHPELQVLRGVHKGVYQVLADIHGLAGELDEDL